MAEHSINLTEMAQTAHASMLTAIDYAGRLAVQAESVQGQLIDEPMPSFLMQVGSNNPDVPRLAREHFTDEVCRYALIFMMAHWERYQLELTGIRSWAELASQRREKGLPAELAMAKRDEVRRAVRRRSVDGQFEDLATDEAELLTFGSWLRGLYAIRRCIVHRAGIVGDEDSDLISGVAWRRMVIVRDGEDIPDEDNQPHFEKGQMLTYRFTDRRRSWGLGEHVVFSPRETSEMAFSLMILANSLFDHVHGQLTKLIAPT